MSETELKQQQQQSHQQVNSSSSSSSSVTSPSNSISIIKLDELSSYGATKKNRLPTLIRMNDEVLASQKQQQQAVSMPAFSAEQLEQVAANKQQASLPVQINQASTEQTTTADKENVLASTNQDSLIEDYQMVDMTSADLMGPSLPATSTEQQMKAQSVSASSAMKSAPVAGVGAEVPTTANAAAEFSLSSAAHKILASSQTLNQQPSYLGDSLIEMIINLRSENQNLVKALETNNEYVKERLNEFKLFNEEAKKREAQFASERAEHDHQVRKLKRQNTVLSDRLKSMEAKLKDMRLEVGESLNAAHSSKASSTQGDLYPALDASMESFSNSALANQATTDTMQVEPMPQTSYDNEKKAAAPEMELGEPQSSSRTEPKTLDNMDSHEARQIDMTKMSKEELSKHFDADKVAFYAMDDPLKQCDKLEQQLNDMGRRDYEICLLQQQLNIYRQDFRLERMANLEAKIQIEKLKSDIDRLCYERLSKDSKNPNTTTTSDEESSPPRTSIFRGSNHRHSASETNRGVRFDAASAAADAVSKLGLHLNKRASRAAAKAAKYASKQAYREEKAAAAAAAAAASVAAASAQTGASESASSYHHSSQHHHKRSGHHHHHRGSSAPMRALRNEVVNDLLSTANKAMLTGYKMASTHVNLAIDKLSQFEQAQAANLEKNKNPSSNTTPSAPPMNSPSLD